MRLNPEAERRAEAHGQDDQRLELPRSATPASGDQQKSASSLVPRAPAWSSNLGAPMRFQSC